MSKILGNAVAADTKTETKAQFDANQQALEQETEQYLSASDSDSQKQGLSKLGELVSRELGRKARPFAKEKEQTSNAVTKDDLTNAVSSLSKASDTAKSGSKLLSGLKKTESAKSGAKDLAVGAGVVAGGAAVTTAVLKAKDSKNSSKSLSQPANDYSDAAAWAKENRLDQPKDNYVTVQKGKVTDHETKMRQLEASGVSDTADYVENQQKSSDYQLE